MSPIDWMLLTALLLSLLIGAWRGLVFEALSLVGWVVAFVAGRYLGWALGQWLPMGDWPEGVRHAVGFAMVFVLMAFLWGLLAAAGRRLIQASGLRPVDRALGGAFGLLRGVLLLLALTWLVSLTPWREAPVWRQAVGVAWLEAGLTELWPLLPEPWQKPWAGGAPAPSEPPRDN